ncbi:ABC transporter substrate-binding protein [Desulfitobacterium sp. AusDCA]|uniref:ABC transporter substrate-binding protein n=1 Tax=Desulfitobacterium sp. AusDCA TaxID=3240383 RepID=UPI003DA6EB42
MRQGSSSRMRLGLTVLICILFLSFSVGCSRAPQQGTPGGVAPAVIEIWHTLQGSEADSLNKQIQHIMDQHPEVLIRTKSIPEAQFAGLIYQAEAGGEGPEIFIAPQDILTKLYTQGALAPVAGNAEVFPGLVAPFHYGDKTYAQPWLTDSPLLFYRKDLVQPLGSLTDWLNSKGTMVLPELNSRTLSTWWSGQGGKLVSSGRPVLDDPANLQFLQQLQTWRDNKMITVDPNALTPFASGQAVYTIALASQALAMTQANIPWGSIPLFNVLGGQGQGLPGVTLGIANSSIKTTTALQPSIKIVEEALLSSEVEGAFAQNGTRFPASTAYYSTADGQKGLAPQVAQALAKVWPLTGDSLERKLLPLQDAAWQSAWGGTAPQDALTQAQTEAVKVSTAK